MSRWSIIPLLLAASALAQGKPTFVDHPLEISASLAPPQRKRLQDDFRQQLARRSGILVSTRSSGALAFTGLNRQDCGVGDDCLQQLAVRGGAAYAIYVAVQVDPRGTTVTATGRVVGRDGVQARVQREATTAMVGGFPASAGTALGRLLEKLELEKLPAKPLPTATVVPSPFDLKAVPWDEPLSPPTPPPEPALVVTRHQRGNPSLRGLAIATTGIAAAGLAAAVSVGIAAVLGRQDLPADGRLLDDAQARQQLEVNQLATVALGVGLGATAFAVTSAVLFIASAPSDRVVVGVAPSPAGASLMVSGRF